MPSADWKVEIVDSSGEADYSVTVVGDQVVDLTGATDGQVLTVQNDGTVAPENPASQVSQTITNGVTTTAPSQDAVFDALALKAPAASATGRHVKVLYTGGDITVNSVTWTNLQNALDLTLSNVTAGQIVGVYIHGLWKNEAVIAVMDAVSVVSGSPVKTWSEGAAEDNTHDGVIGWHGVASALMHASGMVTKAVTADELVDGVLTIRFRARTTTAANKSIFASVGAKIIVGAINFG